MRAALWPAGDDPEKVIRAIAQYRSDKPNPAYYAAHTVEKASASLGNLSEPLLDSEHSR